MRPFAIVILLNVSTLVLGTAHAATISLNGNQAVTEGDLVQLIEFVGCSDSTCVDSVCRVIANHYWRLGHLRASVHCSWRSRDSTLEVTIDEGPRFILGSVEFEDVHLADSTLLYQSFQELIGKPFDPDGVEAGIASVLRLYDGMGYPLVTIRPEMVICKGDTVSLRFQIDEGPVARLREVIFEGLKTTRKPILLAESGLEEGAIFDGSRIASARKRLLDLGIFDQVSEPDLVFDNKDTTVTVRFRVSEAPATYFQGYAAYAPSVGGSLVGSIDLEFRNIGGTLRKLHVLWKRPGPERLAWKVEYNEPRILSRNLSATLTAQSYVLDTCYASRRFSLGLIWRKAPGFDLGMGVVVGSTKDRTPSASQGDFTEKGFTFNLGIRNYDRDLNPTSGYRFEVSTSTTILSYADRDLTRRISVVSSTGNYLVPITPHFVLFTEGSVDGAFSSDGTLPPSHLIRAGGMGSVRGYAEESFIAERTLRATLEPRWLVSENSRLYLFVDGATFGDTEEQLGTDWAIGYGLGMMAMARSGVVRVDVGVAHDETIANARLHFSVVRRF